MSPPPVPIMYCRGCQKPMDEAHPGWRFAKMMGWHDRPCEANNYWLNLHSYEMVYGVMKVYLVEGDYYEQRYICAAFSTKEDAEAYVAKKNSESQQKDYYALGEEVELDPA